MDCIGFTCKLVKLGPVGRQAGGEDRTILCRGREEFASVFES
jgi:hypothetical protein